MRKAVSKFALAAGVMLALIFTAGCAAPKVAQDAETVRTATGGSFTDSRDGKTYKIVKIGEQVWMAENLNYAVSGSKCYGEGGVESVIGYENGDPIKKKLSDTEMQANCVKYGRLYDWNTAMKSCPSGWHLPSIDEYEALGNIVGKNVAGKKLKFSSGWENDSNGTDEFGFSALPGGYGYSGGSFYNVGRGGYWWSASEWLSASSNNDAGYWLMWYDSNYASWGTYPKSNLYSVRCLKD